MNAHDPKQVAGRRAAELVQDGMTLGLGTGSTVFHTLVRLGERIRAEGLRVRGVPTSVDTERKARELGIELATLAQVEHLDLTIDGADEIDGRFDMIKGGGGALLREKVVASISRREAIVAGPEKVVERLGTTFKLASFGCQPHLRRAKDGRDYLTDNGNEILDCHFPSGIADARALELAIDALPGVVESGLFIGLAHVLVIGHPDGRAEVRERS
jgi:ribose 5-phosphate isomerase A